MRRSKKVGYTPPPPRKTLKWLAVDLDGTLAKTVTDKNGNHVDAIGSPIWRNLAKLETAKQDGWSIVLHTSRPWADYERIEHWAKHYGVRYDRIVCGKLLAHRYIDDRAVHESELEWVPQPVSREMQSGRWLG